MRHARASQKGYPVAAGQTRLVKKARAVPRSPVGGGPVQPQVVVDQELPPTTSLRARRYELAEVAELGGGHERPQ